MENTRIVELSMEGLDWNMVYDYFQSYTHVDVNDIPENSQDYVLPMLSILKKEAILQAKYGRERVLDHKTDQIIFREGHAFTGKMIARAYQDAEEIIFYVITISNMEELMEAHPDLMEAFFLEYWAVSVLNTVREMLYEQWQKQFSDDQYQLTYVWSPGQSRFQLNNQRPLFSLLAPEEIGVSLDKYDRMIPLKSVSGTVGILPKEAINDLIACDYCQHAKTCPGYKGKKYIKERNPRLF